MTNTQETILPTSPVIFSWFFRWAAYCVASVGYVFGLFLVQHTLVSWLLLTVIYGAWLVTYHVGKQRGLLSWLLVLFCLACASLFLSLPSANAYWLPILPTMTACMLVAAKPRFLGLLASGILWLGTGLALALLAHQWDAGSQVILLISFGSACGCTTTISELAEAHAQLQVYSAQVEELSMIRERNRIAREIHDTLGHSLTLLAVQLETATQHEMRGDPRLREELLEARQVAKACLTDVRHSVQALRPDAAASSSVQEQLRGLAAEFAATCRQTQITLDLEEATHPLHPELGLTLYRCAQEALTNIRKHACATKVLLRLSTTAEQVELTVLDNGQGEPSEHDPGGSGFGLLGMRERVALLHGTLRAGSEAGHGWRVEVLLPLTMQEEAARTQIHTHSKRKKGWLW